MAARKIEDINWLPFNSDGSEDISIPPAEDDSTFREYKYTASGLSDFTSFQIKIVMKGSISSYPPICKDMRGIALAIQNMANGILKVEGHSNLVRDVSTNAIIRTSNEYTVYMKRIRQREENADQLRGMCSEINNLKKELREIKDLIKEVIKK